MIAIDTNILVYAHRSETPQHATALRILSSLSTSNDSWAIPWPCIHEYLRQMTHTGIRRGAVPLEQILNELDRLLDSPSLMLLGEGPAHRNFLMRAVAQSGATGDMIFDARIAAILLEHGVSEFWTHDRDFRRFPGIVTRNPFVAGDEVHEVRVRYRAQPSWLAGKRAATPRRAR